MKHNWAGNVLFGPEQFHQPASIEALRTIVRQSDRLRVLGTGHSFSPIADTPGDLISLAAMPPRLEIAEDRTTVTVSSGTRYGELAQHLDAAGLALHNMGSLPHISIAGACSTGTHGSGDTNQALAGAVRGLELLRTDGGLITLGGHDLAGATVALGLLGVVTAVTLAVEPSYEMWQLVYDDLPEEVLANGLDEIFSFAYSVSLFTTWRRPGLIDLLWIKGRVSPSDSEPPDPAIGAAAPGLYGAKLADGPRHPIPGAPTLFTTAQGSVPGPWFERLPHFRLEFTPSAGEELQSEFLVPRSVAAEAITALGQIRGRFAHLVQISEFRSVAADELWLSPAFGRDSIGIHFTWVKDQEAVEAVLPEIEAVLAPFDARPHWGKVFTAAPADVMARYPRWSDFDALRAEFDPHGTLLNDMLAPYFSDATRPSG